MFQKEKILNFFIQLKTFFLNLFRKKTVEIESVPVVAHGESLVFAEVQRVQQKQQDDLSQAGALAQAEIKPEVLRSTLVGEATRWLNVREVGGANKGPQVEAFQKAVDGKAQGEPWCCCFVFFCIRETMFKYMQLKAEVPGHKLFESEHVLTVWTKSLHSQRIEKPEVGCLMVWNYVGTYSGHIGVVVEVHTDHVITIEGNTGPGGSVGEIVREGDGVYRKKRPLTQVGKMKVCGYLRVW